MATRKSEVAVKESSVALAERPQGLPLEISAGTIRVPKIKKGEPLAAAVRDGYANFLDIYTTTGSEDTNPKVIAKADVKAGQTADGNAVVLHVLAVREGRSETVNDELVSYTLQGGRWVSSFDGSEAGQNAYVTQTYVVCLPEVDGSTPFELMLYRTSLPAAKNINTALVEHVNKGGAPWELAFELTTLKRSNSKFTWGVFQARSAEANDANVATALDLASQLAAILPKSAPAPVDRPEI